MKKKKFRTKKFLSHLKSASTKFYEKQNNLGLGLKLPYFVLLGQNLKKTIAIFETNTLEFVKMKTFMLRGKKLNLGPKMPHFGIFGKNYCHI